MEDKSNDLRIKRTFNVSVERLWRAWTDPDEIQKWWGPDGVTNPTCVWEVRPGGKINIVMLAGKELGELAGQEWPMSGEFVDVELNKKLVYAASPVMNGKPIMDTLNTVTFSEEGTQTSLTIEIKVTRKSPEAEFALSGMEMGWNQQIDKLTKYIEEN